MPLTTDNFGNATAAIGDIPVRRQGHLITAPRGQNKIRAKSYL